MLVLGPGQQGMQRMAKLMNQRSCTGVMQHAIGLVKAEGQGNDWCLVLPLAQLASTPQCEVGCTRKLALPACRAKLVHAIGLSQQCNMCCTCYICWS